jgi:hypothetical protein
MSDIAYIFYNVGADLLQGLQSLFDTLPLFAQKIRKILEMCQPIGRKTVHTFTVPKKFFVN